MGPARFAAHELGLEAPLELVAGGAGFNQGDLAALVTENQIPVGVCYRCRAAAGAALLPSPDDFAGLELDANGQAVIVLVATVDVAVPQHHPAVMILELRGLQKILLFGFDAVAVLGELQQGRTGLIASGAEDEVATDEGRGDVGGFIGHAVIAPEIFAIAGPHANHAAADELHVLLHSRAAGNDDAGIARAILALGTDIGFGDFALPDVLSGQFIQGHYHRVRSAGRAEHPVPIDQGRLRESPAGHHLAAELLEVATPDFFAAVRLEADNLAARNNRIEPLAINAGSAT